MSLFRSRGTTFSRADEAQQPPDYPVQQPPGNYSGPPPAELRGRGPADEVTGKLGTQADMDWGARGCPPPGPGGRAR